MGRLLADRYAAPVSGAQPRPACWAQDAAGTLEPDPGAAFWRARDLGARASGSEVPVLWAQGLLDLSVRPTQMLDLWTSLRGPRRAWVGQFDHWPAVADDVPGFYRDPHIGRRGFLGEARRWLDRWVKEVPASEAPVEDDPATVIQSGDGTWRGEAAWPPSDARPHTLPVRPGTYRDAPGNKAEDGSPERGCREVQPRCNPAASPGTGTWTFTPPLPHATHLAGAPGLEVRLRREARAVNLVALLYDIDPARNARLISRGAYTLTDGDGDAIGLSLQPQDWRLPAGHRLGLLLSGSDDLHYTPGVSRTDVTVEGGALSVPLLAHERTADLEGGPSSAMGRRSSFEVSQQVIDEGTVAWEPAAPMAPWRP